MRTTNDSAAECSIMCYMTRVGIRELRQNLSVYLARVKAGRTLTVTDRGKSVAILKPLDRHDSFWQELVGGGAVIPATRSWSDIKPPGGSSDSGRSASRRLQEMREERI